MPDQEDSGPIDCPGCHFRMTRTTIEGMEVDRCEKCAGIWLDALEKDRLLAAHAAGKVDLPGPHQQVQRDKEMHCPRDHSLLIRMVDFKQPHIHFESCKICGGMFFDAGELKDLSKFTIVERIRWALKLMH